MSEYVWHFSLKIVKARKGGEETDRRRGDENHQDIVEGC